MSVVSEYFNEYFVKNNKEWLDEAYQVKNYTYPVGKHRHRILEKLLSYYDLREKKVLDIGCGGGDNSFLAASKGAIVTGIDMSPTMIAACEDRLTAEYSDYKDRIQFFEENIKSLSERVTNEKYDYIIAFGLIGYLDSDDEFFDIIGNILNDKAHVILSCRNELFNMTSISDNTKKEITTGNALTLIDEINDLYDKSLDIKKCRRFISELENALKHIEKMGETDIIDEDIPIGSEGTGAIQPRQSTPKGIESVAKKHGLNNVHYYGIHPHLLLPKLNRKLPAQIFNILSDALCVFEDEDIALIYSSVFIGDFVLSASQ